ncbi:FAD-dependent oxidoreductase [Streptomyces yokosukanensis]|uniref:FAD-dependent oxidoreductase n=1 Tax=Streptomyces yokosukanensis TaxID=67386 RepID=A0A101NW91_9ACTN|nr:FAD-dependent oxidoreductase [Streptomyces yokosukanensis]
MTGTDRARRTAADHVDVAIVGAGILGCVTARETLARFPGASIAVIERDAVAAGASRRSAGLHFPRGSSAAVRAMAEHSERYYRTLKEEDPALPIFGLDTTVVAATAGADRLAEHYLPGTLHRTDRLPHGPAGRVHLPEGSGAWQVDGGQYADVHALTQCLAAQLRPAVRFLEGTRVVTVDSRPDGVGLALSSGATLTASKVLLAPGPWLKETAWQPWTAGLGLRVKKVVALHVERRPRPTDGAVVFEDDDAFLLPVHHRGHWLFSYTCAQWDVRPDGTDHCLTPVELAEARSVLDRFAPELVPLCTTGRVFCDAYSPDRVPVVRPVDDFMNVIFAGAANGSGYRLAPAIAADAARLLCPTTVPRSHP